MNSMQNEEIESGAAPDNDSRCSYDLDHFSFQVGRIGQLQTVSCIPVVAGDSMEMNLDAVVKLSPLRRPMMLDTMVDLFAFFVPHRHIYGSNWVDFIKAGYDESVTLGTDTIGNQDISCLGYKLTASTAYPRWLTRGNILIWNNYFRDPSGTATDLAAKATNYWTNNIGNSVEPKYGPICMQPKRLINSGLEGTVDDSDRKVSLTDTNTKFSLTDFALQQARLKTETKRDFFAQARYRDVLNNTFGSYVDYNIDERPELVAHSKSWLSGYDVEGTDAASLGSVVGRAVSLARLNFPRKFFAEHGTLWIMALLRFPAVYSIETHYLVKKAEPTYAQIAGDPDIINGTAPSSLTIADLTDASSSTSLGLYPYAQWYREQPHITHPDYVNNTGWPFNDLSAPTARDSMVKVLPGQLDDIFSTLQLQHWQMNAKVDLKAQRFIPDPRLSIFAGTR